jgi:hypothetical protein
MKNTILQIILLIFASTSGFSEATALPHRKTISISDFGYEPGCRRNVVPIVEEALKQCTASDTVTIVFPKGRYDFWQNFASPDKFTIGIPMENLKNVVIDGGGSEFIFHGNMQIVNMDKCENILLKNFSVDWDQPFIYQGKYVNATDNYIDLEFDKDQYKYVIENNKFYLTGEGWKAEPTGYFNLFDRNTKEILYQTHDGNNSRLFTSKAEEISPGIVRFYGTPDIKPPKGTFTTLMAGRYMTTGIDLSHCKGVCLKDITVYHALSLGVYGVWSENITLDNTNMTINESKGRVFSIIADGFHFSNCKGLIKVVNCAHTGAMDDFINVHGRYTKIDSLISNNAVIASNNRDEEDAGAPGDEIWFVNPGLCQRSDVRVIQSVERLGENISKITFTSPLPKEVKKGDCMENKTWTADLEIRNCRILKQNRARGILVTTPEKVTIEDNYFRSAGTAILIEGDMNYWFESGANRDVTIRNNVFEDCLTSGNITGSGLEWGEAIITITPSHRPQTDKDEPYHQNIHIENNVFKTFDTPLVHARSVRGLTFKNNEIIRTYSFKPDLWQKTSFLLDGCRDVVISGNKIDKDYTNRTVEAEHTKKADIKSEGFNLNIKN